MIKFFRKIRYDLMEKNKTGKYLKYAIGEIVLVVIGILIALQINNWNENRKDYLKSINYLTEIVSDLKKDTIRFNLGMATLNDLIEDEEWVLNTTDYKNKDVNKLWDCFSGWYMDYKINDRTFQKIQNEGRSKLVGFDLLSESINNYYTTLKARSDSFTEWDYKDVTERQSYLRNLEETLEFSNYRMKTISANQIKKEFPMRQDSLTNAQLVIEFANSTRGRNHFKNNYIRHMRLKGSFKSIVVNATHLITEINQELENIKN
jgi:RNAse (barnase) inhibitor barstar